MATPRRRGLGFGLVLGAVLAPPAMGQESPLTEEDRQLFAWFDKLGFPACAGRPFVCLTRTPEKPQKGETPYSAAGFLLAEDAESFTVLGANVFPWIADRKSDGYRVTKEPADLRKVAAKCLEAIREDVRAGHRGGVLPGIGDLSVGEVGLLDTPAAVFVVARRCAENGLEGLAGELLAETRKYISSGPVRRKWSDLRACVAEEIADHVHCEIVVDHGERDVTRLLLLEKTREWLRLYPDSPRRERVEADAKILATMVAEDAKHVATPDDRLAALPVDKRVQELIYRLRDQPGGQWSDPGSPSIFSLGWESDAVGKGATPAGQIEAIGMDAVPALIDVLDDARFTRVLGFTRSWWFESYYVVRTGDAARELLENITGQVFWKETSTSSSMIKDGQGKETKEKYLAWWRARK